MKKILCGGILLLSIGSPAWAQKKQKGFSKKQHQQALVQNYKAIVAMAEHKFCGNPNDFAFVPLGTNPCGGAKEYLVYAKNIDRKQFFQMVEQYNHAEAVFNKKYNIQGACKVLDTPKNIECVNKKPVLVY